MRDTVNQPLQPLRRERHGHWSWQPPRDYGFARALRAVPVTLSEATAAAACFPLVFGDGAEGPMPLVLLRHAASGASLFVGPDGDWRAAWLPSRLAAWPFDRSPASTGGHALALHEGNDAVRDGSGGLPIFAALGSRDGPNAPDLAPDAARCAALLRNQAEDLPATARAAVALQRLGLLTALAEGEDFLIVDAEAAAALGEDTVLALHRAGALGLLHAALVSLAHLPWMARAEQHLAAGRADRGRARTAPANSSSFLAALSAAQSAETNFIEPPSGSS